MGSFPNKIVNGSEPQNLTYRRSNFPFNHFSRHHSSLTAYTAYNGQLWALFWGYVGVAVLFNPLIPIYLSKGIWAVIDVVIAGLYLVCVYRYCFVQDSKSSA